MKLITRIARRPIVIQLVPTGISPTSKVWVGEFRDRRGHLFVSGPEAGGLTSLLTTMASQAGVRRAVHAAANARSVVR